MEMTTYLMVHKDGTRRKITVPASWKVTFGPAAPGERAGGVNSPVRQMPLALRFYETPTQQRAIFTDVVSFRDVSIHIEEEVVNVQEKDGYYECDGKRKRTVFTAKTREWVDPDIAAEKVPLLPSDDEMFEL